MMKRVFFLLSLILFSFPSIAHKDRIIHVSSSGELDGLPEQYLPARLERNRITIGRHELNMPLCVSKYFEKPETYDLFITGSWYHKTSSLPPYINFNIKPKDKDFEYELIFNLDDLSPIKFTVVTHINDEESSFHLLDISDLCRTEIDNSTK